MSTVGCFFEFFSPRTLLPCRKRSFPCRNHKNVFTSTPSRCCHDPARRGWSVTVPHARVRDWKVSTSKIGFTASLELNCHAITRSARRTMRIRCFPLACHAVSSSHTLSRRSGGHLCLVCDTQRPAVFADLRLAIHSRDAQVSHGDNP